tara:strand:- start:22 stop:2325 length:2304 start_codon:yes stop_codon:yes gene_type:complete
MSTIAAYCTHTGGGGGYGGGEMYTFAILSILNRYYDLTVFTNLDYPAFEQAHQYGLKLDNLNWRALPSQFNWRKYDIQINLAHTMMLPAQARRSILFVLFPQFPDWNTSAYDTVVGISDFTNTWIKRYWGRDAELLTPAVPVEEFKVLPKKKSIVSVGRFFEVPGGNNKNHIWMIRCFKKFAEQAGDWELHLVGSVQHKDYFEKVKKEADWRVHFHHDLDRDEYIQLMGEASYYWHAAGYGADKPSGKEHWGIVAVEAMAAGAIPIVHNSGGIQETGALTWDDPQQLVDITLDLVHNSERTEVVQQLMLEKSRDFSLQCMEKPLLEIIEKPVLIPPHVGKAKIFPPVRPPSDIKVGVISDSPRITTGFGVVTKMVVEGLLENKFQVSCLGMYDYDPNPSRYKRDPCKIWRGCPNCNQSTLTHLARFLQSEKPDILYINYDPGNVYNIMRSLEEQKWDSPIIAYFPVEAVPLQTTYGDMIKAVWLKGGVPITYTKWAAERIKEQFGMSVEVAPHGVEHAEFKPLSPEERSTLRYAVGFEGKFVVASMGRNKRVKGMPVLLDAIELLVKAGHEDIVAYLHTNPDEQNQLGSYPLRDMVKQRKLEGKIFFPPDLSSQIRGVPYDGLIEIQTRETESIDEARAVNMMGLNLAQRLGCADLYIDCSQAEGWGMPSTESAMCGTPVIAVRDGVREEVWGEMDYIEPVGYDTWHTAGKLPIIDPKDVANRILYYKSHPRELLILSDQCRTQAQKWSWKVLQNMVSYYASMLVNR